MHTKNVLYILSNGRLAAINKKDGKAIWEIKLKQYMGKAMAAGIGQLYVEDNKIYAGLSGILLCFHAKDGSLLWKNELKGWGYHFISMANMPNDAAASASAILQAAGAAAVVTAAT